MRILSALVLVALLGGALFYAFSGQNADLLHRQDQASAPALAELATTPRAPSDYLSASERAKNPDASVPEAAPLERVIAPTSPANANSTALTRSAQAFVKTLTTSVGPSLPANDAAHFVTAQQIIDIEPKHTVETVSLQSLKLDTTLGPQTPITVIRQVPQIELASPEKLVADAGGDLSKIIEVLIDNSVESISVREALERHSTTSGDPISVIRMSEYLEPTTVAELIRQNANAGGDEDSMMRVIKGAYKRGTASIADLLAGIEGVGKDSVFYVHSVQFGDTQGVWGIIHDALIKNFARGMAVRRGAELDQFQVRIPRDADERTNDNSSSFLGKLIDTKARTSTVYNFRAGRMSRNPNLVVPGSEIVI
ncbi:MAG: hypothetical protein ACI8PT_002147, partial [Gammaproteobacteria bacterium]